jgi:hypothetical protein
LHIDSNGFGVGNKLVKRTSLGYFRALPVFHKKQVSRFQNASADSPTYRREADGLLHYNPALAELVVPSILRAVDSRFVPNTLHYEFCFVENWIYVLILSEDCGNETLENFVFNPQNTFNIAEFSRVVDGIVLQCMFALQTYQRYANFTHADLHLRNVVLRKANSARDLTFILDDDTTKTFHVDADVPEISLIDFHRRRTTLTIHKKNVPKELRDWPIHNANLIYFPHTKCRFEAHGSIFQHSSIQLQTTAN